MSMELQELANDLLETSGELMKSISGGDYGRALRCRRRLDKITAKRLSFSPSTSRRPGNAGLSRRAGESQPNARRGTNQGAGRTGSNRPGDAALRQRQELDGGQSKHFLKRFRSRCTYVHRRA